MILRYHIIYSETHERSNLRVWLGDNNGKFVKIVVCRYTLLAHTKLCELIGGLDARVNSFANVIVVENPIIYRRMYNAG